MPHTEFFGETSNHPGDSAPLQPRFGALQLLAFPKIKTAFQREEISDCWWHSGNTTGKLMAIGRTVWDPKVPTLKGTEVSLSCVQCFLYLISYSVNVSIFQGICLDTLWKDLICWLGRSDLLTLCFLGRKKMKKKSRIASKSLTS